VTDARCIFVAGRRGSGKTTFTRAAVEASPRVVAFDPIGQYGREFGWPMADTLAGLHDLLTRCWRAMPWHVAFTPPGDYPRELHRLSIYLWHAQLPYERRRDRKKLVLVVEEMNLSVPVHALPADQRGFMRLVLQGRHRGVEIIGVTQRPALVSADFRSMAAETVLFPLGFEDHGYLGARHRAELASLTPHHFLRVSDGVASRGENVLSRRSPASSPRRIP
jgi:hypothetical protein